MVKKILAGIVLVLLVFTMGCSNNSSPSSPPSQELVRKGELGAKWQMYQIRTEVPIGQEFTLLLKLADGDKVDGYFYLEKGNNIDFRINGNSMLYKSETTAGKVTSDRFSFVASQTQGSSYVLAFKVDSKEKEKDVVFMEVILPASAQVFMPLEAK